MPSAWPAQRPEACRRDPHRTGDRQLRTSLGASQSFGPETSLSPQDRRLPLARTRQATGLARSGLQEPDENPDHPRSPRLAQPRRAAPHRRLQVRCEPIQPAMWHFQLPAGEPNKGTRLPKTRDSAGPGRSLESAPKRLPELQHPMPPLSPARPGDPSRPQAVRLRSMRGACQGNVVDDPLPPPPPACSASSILLPRTLPKFRCRPATAQRHLKSPNLARDPWVASAGWDCPVRRPPNF